MDTNTGRLVAALLVLILAAAIFGAIWERESFELERDLACLTAFQPTGDMTTPYGKELLRVHEDWC